MGRKKVEVIALFDMNGKPTPVRVRLPAENGENLVLKIDRILRVDQDRTTGNLMLKYYCETLKKGQLIPFELRYEATTFCWFIYERTDAC